MNQIAMNGQDYDRLLSDLKAHITKEISGIKNIVVEKPLTYQGAADYLGIHVNTLYKRIRTGHYPSSIVHKDDGTVHFFASELYQFIKKS
jgi:hypothetical protein